jgi:16S rRNA (adenine1518-N6/adenine1519-N6)-dimethyltransferase
VARQKLGQHFLHSKAILERIAAEACPEGCDLVVEIGPGKGALTEYLLRRATRVKAVELDPELAAALAER